MGLDLNDVFRRNFPKGTAKRMAARIACQERLQALAQCARKWRRQQSAPYTFDGETFDMVPGSVACCSELHDALRTAIVCKQRSTSVAKLRDHLPIVAELDQCFFGTVKPRQGAELEAGLRAGHERDGWRDGVSRPFTYAGLTFDVVRKHELAVDESNKPRILYASDRTTALYHELRAAVHAGGTVDGAEEMLQRADARAVAGP